jgi:hypothetical protein
VLKLIASGVVAASVLLGSTALGAESALVSKADRHGDVRVHGSTDGVDPAVLDSVDLRHVTVTRQRHGVRVVVRLKQVLPPRGRWFQQVSITMTPPGWFRGTSWFFAAFATPQHLGGAAAIYAEVEDEGDEPNPEEEEVFCRVAASKGAKVVRLVIPDRCLPKDAGDLTVSAVLLDRRGDNPLFAEDEMAVGGLVDLQPSR